MCGDASPVKRLFTRVATLDESVSDLDLHADPEMMRWPVERQRAALALLRYSPHVRTANLSGLQLMDDVAPAVAAMRAPRPGRMAQGLLADRCAADTARHELTRHLPCAAHRWRKRSW